MDTIILSVQRGTNNSFLIFGKEVSGKKEITITDCDTAVVSVNIPMEIDEKKGTEIEDLSGKGCKSLKI